MYNSNVLAHVTLDSFWFDENCFDSDEQKQLFLNSSEQEQKDLSEEKKVMTGKFKKTVYPKSSREEVKQNELFEKIGKEDEQEEGGEDGVIGQDRRLVDAALRQEVLAPAQHAPPPVPLPKLRSRRAFAPR